MIKSRTWHLTTIVAQLVQSRLGQITKKIVSVLRFDFNCIGNYLKLNKKKKQTQSA